MQTFRQSTQKYKRDILQHTCSRWELSVFLAWRKRKIWLLIVDVHSVSANQNRRALVSQEHIYRVQKKKNELNHKMINIASTPPPLKTPKPINMLILFFCIFIGLGGQRCLILHWESILKCLCTGDSKLPHHSRWKVAYCDVKKQKQIMPIQTFRWAQRNFPTFSRKHQTICTHINTVSILVRLSD